MAIKKVTTLQEYAALQHSASESDVTLVTDENLLMYNGVNIQVTIPKPGDVIYRDAAGKIHFVALDTLNKSLLPADWEFVDNYYYGWSEDPWVDMGLPSGLKWAKSNIDVRQQNGFAKSPYQYDNSFFSWGNTDAHHPTSNSSFSPYTWGGVNETEPYYENQPYGSTPGAQLNASFTADSGHDAAREILGGTCRMPSASEFQELFDNSKYIDAEGNAVPVAKADKRVSVNGVMGLYLQSKINGSRIFFACSGYGDGTSWNNRGSVGVYWSSTFSSARDARSLNFGSGGVYPQRSSRRFNGLSVRAVQ